MSKHTLDEPDEPGRTLSTVDRSTTVIEALRELKVARLNEISKHIGFSRSTTHIHLKTLESNGYVVHDNNGYRLSLKFISIGGEIYEDLKIVGATRPELKNIALETDEKADLMIEELGQGVLLRKEETDRSIDDNYPIGAHMHLHSIALGKAMLATLSDETVETIVDRHGLPQYTPNTITTRELLLDELKTIRGQDFALNLEEHSRGVHAVAVPIESKRINGPAAISLSGPQKRMGLERMQNELTDTLLEAKNVIELRLDHY